MHTALILHFFYLTLLVGISFAQGAGCAPGYYIAKQGSCKKCPKGTFQPDPDRHGCKPCPDNTVSMEEGSVECTACGASKEPSAQRTECVCIVGAVSDRRGNCNLCEPGSYFFAGRRRARCYFCASGRYQPEAGQTTCLLCPDGTSSSFGATECLSCPKGQFAMSDGKCGTCPAGQTKDEYGYYCSDCDPGTFKAEAGLAPCLPCPPDTHSDYGATECTHSSSQCPLGEQPIGKNGKCGKCRPGSYYEEYSKTCEKCEKNYFMPYENVADTCLRCAEGSFTKKKGARKCVKCPLGQRLLNDGTCGTCPAGQYFDDHRERCKECPINRYRSGSMKYCKKCPHRTYALPGSSTCFTCPDGEALLTKTGKCGMCPAGTHYEEYTGRCAKCDAYTFQGSPGAETRCKSCPGGTTPNKKKTACVPVLFL